MHSAFSTLSTGSPQYQEPSPKLYIGQGLFPDQGDETLPDDVEEEEDEDDRLSMVALETELQKYLHEDWRLNLKGSAVKTDAQQLDCNSAKRTWSAK